MKTKKRFSIFLSSLLILSINLISCTNNVNTEIEKDSLASYLQNKDNPEIKVKPEIQNNINSKNEEVKIDTPINITNNPQNSIPKVISTPTPMPTATPTPEPSLFNLVDMLNGFSNALAYNLSFIWVDEKYTPFSNDQISKYLKDESFSRAKEEQVFYIRKYLGDIYNVINKTKFVNSELIYFEPDANPVFFAKYKDNLAFVISTAQLAFTLNSLNLDETNRAKKVLKEYNLPLLTSFRDRFKGADIKYFGLTLAYGVRNFLTDKDHETKVEVISFVFTMDNLNKYLNAEISDNDFIKASDVFLRSKGTYQFKKIDLFNN